MRGQHGSTRAARAALGLAAAALTALALGAAGCGSGSGGAGSTKSAGGDTPSEAAGGSLAKSHLRILTQLKQPQLCGTLTRADANRILGARTAAPVYTSRPGTGVTCEWIQRGAGHGDTSELYVAVSRLSDWAATKAQDKALRPRHVKIKGHEALAAAKTSPTGWAQVDVALGAAHDPVADYRAPTLAQALALAKATTPRLIAMG